MDAAHRDILIKTLKDRFAKNMRRHAEISWDAVQARLEANPGKLDPRKKNKPGGNAIEMASSMGIEMRTEQQYRELLNR